MSDTLMTEKQVADILQVKPTTLKRWRWSGVGPTFYKIGGSVRYKLTDLEKFIIDSQHIGRQASDRWSLK